MRFRKFEFFFFFERKKKSLSTAYSHVCDCGSRWVKTLRADPFVLKSQIFILYFLSVTPPPFSLQPGTVESSSHSCLSTYTWS
jgi:hypothetical protein